MFTFTCSIIINPGATVKGRTDDSITFSVVNDEYDSMESDVTLAYRYTGRQYIIKININLAN